MDRIEQQRQDRIAEEERKRLETERAESDKRIAAAAAENARLIAEAQAEAEKQAIIATAAREKAEAEAKVKAAEDARLAKEVAEIEEGERKAEIERERAADKNHRHNIEMKMVDAIEAIRVSLPDGHCLSGAIVEAISKRQILHLTINY